MLTQVNPWFAQQVEAYLIDPDYAPCEKRLLHAAHFLATKWEFDIIYDFSRHVHGIENTRAEIENQIEDHYELIGVQKLALKRKTERFVSLCGQLRFQRRWAQSPRVPETSVLGHMLTVAIMSYLCTIDYTECEKRRYNNFFVALFHDLPEVLTRDIASPIKSAVAGLEDIVKEYEKKQMEERVLPFLPAHWRDEVRYFTENEFSSRVIVDGIRKDNVGIEELNRCYNENKYDPVDGDVLKVCDNLSAFVEACLSCDHGIQSRHLTEGISRLSEKYDSEYSLAGLPFGELFADFRKMAEPVLSEKEPVV
jgi:putative hydrolase of HD superfamily